MYIGGGGGGEGKKQQNTETGDFWDFCAQQKQFQSRSLKQKGLRL